MWIVIKRTDAGQWIEDESFDHFPEREDARRHLATARDGQPAVARHIVQKGKHYPGYGTF